MKKLFSVLVIVLLVNAINNEDSFAQYNVNGGANITTLQLALTAASNTAGATVTLNITASVAAETASILPTGTRTGTLLIRPVGNRTITTADPAALITFDNADFVIIDGTNLGAGNSLTLVSTNVALPSGLVLMINGSSNNIVRNCKVMGVGVGTTQGGRLINIGQSALDAQGGNNNNIIERDTVIGGRRGIQVFGSAPLAGQLGVTNDNTIIRNNVVKNNTSIGIFVGSETRNNTVDSNEVFMDPGVVMVGAGLNFRAINCQGVGTNNITKNRIHDLSSTTPTSTYFGILSIPVTLTAPGSNLTTNNFINNCITLMTNNDGQVIGFDLSNIAQDYTGNVLNNTVRLAGSSTIQQFSAALLSDNNQPGSTINIFNNIAINGKTSAVDSSTQVGLDLTTYPATGITLNSDYNLAKATDTITGFDAGYNLFIYRNAGGLLLYKQATCGVGIEQHTMFKNANFTGLNDCHLGLVGGDMCGTPLVAVPRDIDNQLRNATYPYKGCDEKTDPLKVLTVTAKLQGVTNQDEIQVQLVTSGCVIRSTGTADISAAGVSRLCYGDSVSNGTLLYIIVKTQRHIQTSSSGLQSFTGGVLAYNFTTAASKAFGNNLVNDGGLFAFYGGDVNQDGTIDVTDLGLIDNAAFNFESGCRLSTDVNNDQTVDVTDAGITDNNAFNFIGEILPCPVLASIVNTSVTRTNISKAFVTKNVQMVQY